MRWFFPCWPMVPSPFLSVVCERQGCGQQGKSDYGLKSSRGVMVGICAVCVYAIKSPRVNLIRSEIIAHVFFACSGKTCDFIKGAPLQPLRESWEASQHSQLCYGRCSVMGSNGTNIKYTVLGNAEAGRSIVFQCKQVLKSHSIVSNNSFATFSSQ